MTFEASRMQRLLLGMSCLVGSQFASAVTDILVLQSHDSPPYQQMLTGFQTGLASHGLSMKYSVQVLHSETPENIEQMVKNQLPRIIFSLGTPASRAVLNEEHSIPIVTGLVLGDERRQQNATGIGLAFPATTHWLWLRRLLPNARRIAVIYDANHASQLFQTMQQLARPENIELLSMPVQTAAELPTLLQQLPTQLDALWALDGAAAFNSVTVRELLLYSFRNRTPLIGLSEQWVKAGALYALDWDYADLGNQAADLVLAILTTDTKPADLPPQTPRKVRIVFNGKTTEQMKLSFPERWLPEISEAVQ